MDNTSTSSSSPETNISNYITTLFKSTIGNNITFQSPFGPKQIIYTDFTASGRGLSQIETFISEQILPFYANVHSFSGYLPEQSEAFRQEAKSIVRRYCNTDENNSIIFSGQGTTSCINKLITLLNLPKYNHFHTLLYNLSTIYNKCIELQLTNEIFEQVNTVLIDNILNEYKELFLYENYCYSNRWGGFDCVLCRMNFTTETQYNEHEKGETHKTKVNEIKSNDNINSSLPFKQIYTSFITRITANYNHLSKSFIYDLMNDVNKFKPIVFISIYEHNSNILPWRETTSTIEYISNETDLELKLKQYEYSYIKMGTFTAGSNITGKLIDVDSYAILMHKHQGLAFFDYATVAPYIKIDMNKKLPTEYRDLLGFSNTSIAKEDEYLSFKDAVFFSPHKFLGGTNTPGVLLIQQRCIRNFHSPSQPGGGSVLFVTKSSHNYIKCIENREESGTPDIIGSVRIGLSILIREYIPHEYIIHKDNEINTYVINSLSSIPNIHLLYDTPLSQHIPIYSFIISYKGKFFHPNFISVLLNDIFGIQSRPGCSCASLYGQHLLGISEEYLTLLETLTVNGNEIYRPGYTRINFPYFYPQYIIEYIVFAIQFIAKNAFKFLPFYAFKMESGRFYHRNENEKKKWLNEIQFNNGMINIPDFFEENERKFINEDVINTLKQQAIALGSDRNVRFMLKNVIGKSKMSLDALFGENEHARWFLIYDDIEDIVRELKEEVYTQYYTTPLTIKGFNLQCNYNSNTDSSSNSNQTTSTITTSITSSSSSTTTTCVTPIPSTPLSSSTAKAIPKKLMKLVAEASRDFNMLQPNDKVLVGVSGGKDSLTLLHVLLAIQKKIPFPISIAAITVNPQSEDYDPSPLKAYMKQLNVPFFFESDSIMKRAKESLQNNSICAYCARMKRGIIYNTARREGYNVIALGQHLDDLAESFLMSVFHNGLLRTMKANYTIDAGDLRVIRPFIYCREKLFKEYALVEGLPVIQENCPACFSSPKERQRMKVLLAQQENLFPNLFSSLQKAMMPLMRGIIKDEDISSSNNKKKNKEDDIDEM